MRARARTHTHDVTVFKIHRVIIYIRGNSALSPSFCILKQYRIEFPSDGTSRKINSVESIALYFGIVAKKERKDGGREEERGGGGKKNRGTAKYMCVTYLRNSFSVKTSARVSFHYKCY